MVTKQRVLAMAHRHLPSKLSKQKPQNVRETSMSETMFPHMPSVFGLFTSYGGLSIHFLFHDLFNIVPWAFEHVPILAVKTQLFATHVYIVKLNFSNFFCLCVTLICF